MPRRSDPELDLPAVVSVGRSQGAGFLGVDYDPFVVARPGELPNNVANFVATPRYERRLGLLNQLEDEFADRGGPIRRTRTTISPSSR